MIRIKNISKTFSKKNKPVLVDISLDIENGEIIGIFGNNGSGKSTLLRIINGILLPDAGTITADEKFNISALNTCFINSETHSLYERLTGFQNLDYFCSLFQIPDSSQVRPVRQAIKELAEEMHLFEHLDCKVSDYSMGMKQKLCILTAFSRKCTFFLLDEITDHLDQQTIDLIHQKIVDYSKNGCAIIEISRKKENLHPECTKIFKLENGKLEQQLL